MLNDLRIALYLWQAYTHAKLSNDRSTQNGAIIIDEARESASPLSVGWNSLVPGWGHKDEAYERPLKYSLTEHAERAAIYKAARKGERLEGMTMVANWVACPDCARAIVWSGIKRVICHKQCMDRTPPRWKEMVDLGLEILTENRMHPVEVIQWDGSVKDVTGMEVPNLNSGEFWYP